MDEHGPPPVFDYPALLRGAILEVVRGVLGRVADEGLPGEHHFYLTFATSAPGVQIPPLQRQQYPEEMTIVLQNQFSNLVVDDEGFTVTLRFSGRPERLKVSWPSLRLFADPSVGFALRLPLAELPPGPDTATDGSGTLPAATAQASPEAPAKVVDFGAFRRRSETPEE